MNFPNYFLPLIINSNSCNFTQNCLPMMWAPNLGHKIFYTYSVKFKKNHFILNFCTDNLSKFEQKMSRMSLY